MTFQREMMQQRAEDIKHSLSMILGELGTSDAYSRYLIFSPLTYNGEITKLT